MWKIIAILVLMCSCSNSTTSNYREYLFSCSSKSTHPICSEHLKSNAIYLLYDVNLPEGFNLRRDVYIRMAVFVHNLQRKGGIYSNIKLVLSPWRRLYHWKSNSLKQENLEWSHFFDLDSMRRFAPILDFSEFLEEISGYELQESPFVPVHRTLQLVHFEDMFENGVFRDKYEFVPERECVKEQYTKGAPLQQSILLDNEFVCVRFQGSANLLENVLHETLAQYPQQEPKVFVILNAEIVLHDNFGGNDFWRARRSMRFATHLYEEANSFRSYELECSDEELKLQRPIMWEMEKPSKQPAHGCPYMCAHLRRGDFVYGREKYTPTLKSAAEQIKQQMKKHNLTTLFLATDASLFERQNLHAHLQRMHVVRYIAQSLEHKMMLKDGGVAIIDQIICSQAQYFMGTYESTFTYRIYEEREIMGFTRTSTFNTICKNTDEECSKNSIWPIVY